MGVWGVAWGAERLRDDRRRTGAHTFSVDWRRRGSGRGLGCSRRPRSRRRPECERCRKDLGHHDQAADLTGGTEQGLPAHQAAVGVLPGLWLGPGRLFGGGHAEQAARPGQAVDLDTVGEQTEVAYPDEAPGDDMEQETAGELGSGNGQGLLAMRWV